MFADREDAGRQLAARLEHLRGERPVVLGLPRGGVVVAAEIARALGAPLEALVVRKVGAPFQPELALGAVIDGNPPQLVRNEDLIETLRIDEEYLRQETERQLTEARRRQEAYRRGRPPVDIVGRTVIIVDDGIATGATMKAALTALSQSRVKRLVLAVPVGPPDTISALKGKVDELVYIDAPPHFRAVGAFYGQFTQTTDEEVVALLEEANRGES